VKIKAKKASAKVDRTIDGAEREPSAPVPISNLVVKVLGSLEFVTVMLISATFFSARLAPTIAREQSVRRD
jgi:hypothetical protein